MLLISATYFQQFGTRVNISEQLMSSFCQDKENFPENFPFINKLRTPPQFHDKVKKGQVQ